MRQVAILGAALGVTLVAAYLVWTDDSEEVDPDAVAMYAATDADLVSVTWTDDHLTVTAERRTDAHGTYLWFESTETTEVAVARDPGSDTDADPDTQEMRTETVSGGFLGNEQADEMWAKFAPLLALRELSGAGTRNTFGLDEPSATVEVRLDGQTQTLLVGGETFGARDRYVALGDRLFLVDDRTLRPLQYAKTRLVARALAPVAREDIASIAFTLGGETTTFTHGNPDDRANEFWAIDGSDERDEAAKTWIGKVLRLSVQAYVDEADVEAPLEPWMSYAITGPDGAWTVDVLRTTEDADDPTWYARSAFNRSLVELNASTASDAFADAEEILGR